MTSEPEISVFRPDRPGIRKVLDGFLILGIPRRTGTWSQRRGVQFLALPGRTDCSLTLGIGGCTILGAAPV